MTRSGSSKKDARAPSRPKRSARKTAAKVGRTGRKKTTKRARKGASPGRTMGAATSRQRSARDFRVVGIGASAGGLDALERLLRAVPPDASLAFLLVQHLDPRHKSRLSEILSRATSMPVKEAKDEGRIEAGHVYTIPANTSMVVTNRHVSLRPREADARRVAPIDDLLLSLARAEKEKAVSVILSGTASDGAAGTTAVKDAGGTTFAQDAGSARYFEMPRAAIQTGAVDFVLPPEEIASFLARLGEGHGASLPRVDEGRAALLVDRGETLAALFRDLQRTFGVDFSAYKQSTVGRRIRRRMAHHGVESLESYLRLVRDRPEELKALYEEMFVGVTGFFREPDIFAALKRVVFPCVFDGRETDDPVRVWVPGCSTGEEVYSIAISLLEHLKDLSGSTPIQIFGTDLNEEAIRKARLGRYPARVASAIGKERLHRFFLKKDDGYQISKTVRDLCVFARHDVVRDPPFSRLDLLSCRNLLIYLGPGLQHKLVPLFHYGLRADGFLLLGSAETIGGHADLFDLVDRKAKIYKKKPGVVVPRLDAPADAATATPDSLPVSGETATARSDVDRHRDAADLILLNQYAPGAVLVNEAMEILHFRGHTGAYLEPSPGVASLNLLKMAREGLLVGLQKALETARETGAPAHALGLHLESEGHGRTLDVRVVPVRTPISDQRTYLVLFQEMGESTEPAPSGKSRRTSEKSREAARSRAVQLRQELAATKAYLQSLIENQEAGNEELRSTNEELLSTNEELQSTTEELETANEELQSANEELVTLNEELHRRNAELGEAHADILNLLAAAGTSLVIVDQGLRIRRFTPLAQKVLGLHEGHAGRPIGELRLHVDIPELEPLLREVTAGGSPVEQQVQDQDGVWYSLRIRPFMTVDNKLNGAIVALTDIHAVKQIEERFRVALLPAPITVFSQDRDLRFTWLYKPLEPWTSEDLRGKTDREVFPPEEADELVALKQRVLKTGVGTRETVTLTIGGERRSFDVFVEPSSDRHGRVYGITCAIWDVTEQERARDQARHLAVLEERNRLAREMHDGLSQDLVALVLQLEAAEAEVARNPGGALRVVREARDRVREVLEGARRALADLRPRRLEGTDLAGALDRLVAEVGERMSARVRSRVRGPVRHLGPETEGNLFRVAREALLNAARHAEAKSVTVELAFAPDTVELEVRDDGRGFDPESARSDGFGFTTMRERVDHIGGRISIDSSPGEGTRVRVRVDAPPLEETP